MVTLAILGGLAQAQNASPTINAIRQSGEVILGYGRNGIPFTYVIPEQKTPLGFAHDLELVVAEHLRKKLNMPDLKIKYQGVNFNNSISMVSKGAVHLHCGVSTNLVENQKEVAFSNAFFVATTRLLVRKDSGIKSLADMKGRKMGSLNKSWSMQFAKSKRTQMGLGEIRGYNILEESMNDLNTGQIEAFFMGDGVLAGLQMQLKEPDAWHIVGKGAGSQRYGCMMLKGDVEFKALVDEALALYYSSGAIYELFDKWFKEPIHPKGLSLNMEMSDAIRNIYLMPTDKAIGQD